MRTVTSTAGAAPEGKPVAEDTLRIGTGTLAYNVFMLYCNHEGCAAISTMSLIAKRYSCAEIPESGSLMIPATKVFSSKEKWLSAAPICFLTT